MNIRLFLSALSSIGIMLSTLGSIACIYASDRPSTVLAKINDSVITQEVFDKIYLENLRFFPLKPPSKKAVLDDLVKRELGIQEAKRLGLDKDPEVINRINTVLYHALIEKQLNPDFENIHISDQEAKDYYEQNPEIRTSHIFVAIRANATPDEEKDARDKMKKIESLIASGKMSFSEIAQRFSEAPDAPMGGDLGYKNREEVDPAFYEAALAIKTPGKMTPAIRTLSGIDKIKLTAIRPWDETDKAQNKRRVFERDRTLIFESYMAKLKQKEKNWISHPEFLPN